MPVPPRISIIIPTYQAAATLERTLESLFRQEYPNLELILMDGGSTDGTAAIASRHAGAFAHLVSERDGGQAQAINKGFSLATGEILNWLCADDELADGALHGVAQVFAENPAATVVTGGCCRHFPGGSIVETHPPARAWERLRFQNTLEQPSTFWKRTLMARAGHLDESLRYAFDFAWWNVLRTAGGQLASTNDVWSHYHFSDQNKTSKGGREMVREMYQVVKKHGPGGGLLADLYWLFYTAFDLHGCMDKPVRECTRARLAAYRLVRSLGRKVFGREAVDAYNWGFAARQERGLQWWGQ